MRANPIKYLAKPSSFSYFKLVCYPITFLIKKIVLLRFVWHEASFWNQMVSIDFLANLQFLGSKCLNEDPTQRCFWFSNVFDDWSSRSYYQNRIVETTTKMQFFTLVGGALKTSNRRSNESHSILTSRIPLIKITEFISKDI